MPVQLLVHNSLFLGGGLLSLALTLFVLWQRRGRYDSLSITFILMLLSIMVFQLSHVFGIMAVDASTSRSILMFNLSVIFIGIFMVHWFIALIGKERELQVPLFLIYVTGLGLFLYFLVNPLTYLVDSVPKLYFPFYYEPGKWQWVMRLWFNVVVLYGLYELYRAYRHTTDRIQKNRYWYVFASILYGFLAGSSAILLVYNIPFDPLWSSFFGLFTIPLAYCVVRYELMDVRIAAKNAFIYAGLTLLISVLMIVAQIVNDQLIRTYPGFPRWLTPVVAAMLLVAFALFLWKQFKQAELLKYEFMNIITHKFRAPLTHVRWAIESLLSSTRLDPADRQQLGDIAESNSKLVGLVSALVTVSDSESREFLYKMELVHANVFVEEIVEKNKTRFIGRHSTLVYTKASSDPLVRVDKSKMEFVLQTLLENALLYGGSGGLVEVSVRDVGGKVHIVVKDSGIGFSKEVSSQLFKKFYRASNAKKSYTEGLGIGLYMSKQVLLHSGGSISMSSEGEGKGATFTVTLERA